MLLTSYPVSQIGFKISILFCVEFVPNHVDEILKKE